MIANAGQLRDDDTCYPRIKAKLRSLVDLVLQEQRPDGGLDYSRKWWRQKTPAIFLILDWVYRNLIGIKLFPQAGSLVLKIDQSRFSPVDKII